ncbi:MAG: AraC family transcriptional regulator [Clostridia bacterium]|nr:AraC family transcriptional regulator [Clostridia bacterium]
MKKSFRKEFKRFVFSYTVTDAPEPSHFERHCHRIYELLYVVKGRGRYVVDGTEYPLCDNTLLLLRPYEFHYVCPDKKYPYERYVFHFERDALLGAATDLSMISDYQKSTNGVYFDKEGIGTEIVSAFEEAKTYSAKFEDKTAEESFIRLTLSRVLLLLSLSKPQEPVVKQENLIANVIEYLNLNINRRISLDALAQHFFVSKYYLCHSFRKHTGVSVFSYIKTKRIAMAQQLLANGEPAASVAYQVGFSDYSSFYRTYCNLVGVPPVHRRTSMENQGDPGGMEMKIRRATAGELPQIMEIYAKAREYMKQNGNPDQWKDNYPPTELIREDIEREKCYLCVSMGEIYGVFYFCEEDDPTYSYIENGKWLNDSPYGVIHRIAVAKHGKGVASFCFDYALSLCGNLKIDTHAENLPMQKALAKNGFTRCGTIYLEDGSPRIAYQKSMIYAK